MKRSKRLTAWIVTAAVLAAILLAGILCVAIGLRPVTFTATDGSSISGWSWFGKVYIDAAGFESGQNVELDIEGRAVVYTEPVDEDALREEIQQAADRQLEEETAALDDEIAALQAQLAEREEEINELQARVDEMEEDEPAGSTAATGTRSTSTSGAGSGQSTGTGGGATGTPAAPESPHTPATPAPIPPPAPEPAPSVDAAACISQARAYAVGLGLTEDSSLSIGNSGYLNPPDISVLSQDSVISDLKHCIDVYASYSPDDPSLVHFNIVQSGNLIYVLYQ